jgi:hypothetical protein
LPSVSQVIVVVAAAVIVVQSIPSVSESPQEEMAPSSTLDDDQRFKKLAEASAKRFIEVVPPEQQVRRGSHFLVYCLVHSLFKKKQSG